MDKFLAYKSLNKYVPKKYDNYYLALEDENKAFTSFKGIELSEIDKVKYELFNIKRYIMDNNIEFDEELFNRKLSLIEGFINDNNTSDYAKIYLYLLEKDLFPEIESSFKTMDYLYTLEISNDRIEKYLKKVFLLVCEQYALDSEEYYNGIKHR